MKLIKPIIAVFLLLTYSFAFAVELVPHCHINHVNMEKGESHHHNVHQHVSAENKEASNVVHENHLDDNLLDFVICFLSELEHPESDIFHEHLIVSESNNTNRNVLYKTVVITTFILLSDESNATATNTEYTSYSVSSYQSLITESSPHRGPPTFSCF